MDLFPAPQGGAPFLQQLGKWAAVIYTYRPMIQMEIHLILSALFPIIIGSHASLKRPSSAAPPENEDSDESEDSELEDKVDQPLNAGLTPSDAIIFPITAGLTLGGLYFVIVWMDKADLVNTIMNAYLSGRSSCFI
jgi:minor histocompatibility antigen H13